MKKLLKSITVMVVTLLLVSGLTVMGFADSPDTVILPGAQGYTQDNWAYHNTDYCVGADCLDYRYCNWEGYNSGHSDWNSEFHNQWHNDHGRNNRCGWNYETTTYRSNAPRSYGRGGGCCH